MHQRTEAALSITLTLCAVAMVGLLGYRTLVADRAGAQQFDQGPVRVGSPARFVEGGIHVGPKDAIVTVAEFADFECPACAAFSSDLKAVMEEHPQEIAYVFHHFPLRQHRFARPAARVAECAHEQALLQRCRTCCLRNRTRSVSNAG